MVKEELGAEIEEIFDEWDWNPLGAASLGKLINSCHEFHDILLQRTNFKFFQY